MPVSGLLEPFRLGEKAPAGHSRKNVCQRTMLFEELSPLETYLSNKSRETSTNYTFLQLQAVHLGFHLPLTPGRSESGAHRRVIATNTLGKALQFANPALSRLEKPSVQILVAMRERAW